MTAADRKQSVTLLTQQGEAFADDVSQSFWDAHLQRSDPAARQLALFLDKQSFVSQIANYLLDEEGIAFRLAVYRFGQSPRDFAW